MPVSVAAGCRSYLCVVGLDRRRHSSVMSVVLLHARRGRPSYAARSKISVVCYALIVTKYVSSTSAKALCFPPSTRSTDIVVVISPIEHCVPPMFARMRRYYRRVSAVANENSQQERNTLSSLSVLVYLYVPNPWRKLLLLSPLPVRCRRPAKP